MYTNLSFQFTIETNTNRIAAEGMVWLKNKYIEKASSTLQHIL